MSEQGYELTSLRKLPALRGLLDHMVDLASLNYYLAVSRQLDLDPETGVPETGRIISEDDPALLELAFYADARAHADDSGHTLVMPDSWVAFAKQSIRRVAPNVPPMQGLEKSRLFADHNVAGQVEIHDAVQEHLRVLHGPAIEASTSVEYAARAALREIVFDGGVIPGEID